MKLVFEKETLLKSVNIVMKAVPTRTTMTIQECIMIDASSNIIKFITNDMEIGIETIVEGTILEKGKAAIDAKTFSEIVRKLPNSDITISTDDRYTATIKCEKANFKIPGRSGDDFNYLPLMDKTEGISLSQFSLKEVIRQTIFSLAQKENNKLMTGELFEIKNNILQVVSLDGHRISIRRMELAGNYQDKKVVIPGKTLNDISKIITGELDQVIHMYFMENYVLFEFDQTILLSRLIDGEYFRIDQMLSSDYETKVTFNKREFMDSIERSILLVKEDDKKPLILTISDEEVHVSINTPIGSMNEDMSCHKTGKDIQIGFNPKFLMDALRVIDEETIDMYLVNSKAPCFIKDENESYVYLILPVNINA